MSKRRGRIKDKWRDKKWYTVMSPPYFGGVELGAIPADDPSKLIGRIVDSTLYDITNDFAHQYLKLYFRVEEVEGKTARTVFKGHEYSRDFLRSLVRRRTTRVDGIFNVTTKDNYGLTLAVSVFTLSRIKTSQEQVIRSIMSKIVKEKASTLTFDQFVQELVLGKVASDIYNESKKISPLRHVGVRKSKLTLQPAA
jgi:small subunit ribosomal protein S3Ae